MTTYRGLDGFLSIGGILTTTAGNVLLNGALIAGAQTLGLDGTGLQGVVMKGDTFTIAGETGTPVHTVTNGPLTAAAGAVAGVQFTPGIAGGGAADNAVMTWVSNVVVEARTWNVSAQQETLEDTALGDKWKTFVGGAASWSGQGEANLDYSDARQKTLIDKLLTATPALVVDGVLFGSANNKQWFGSAVLSGIQIAGGVGDLFKITFSFAGSGALLPNWN
jgi:hypothetical protein